MDEKLRLLTAKKGRLDSFRPLPSDLLQNLNGWLDVELTYTSNAIEGNTLTRAETALVVEKGITVQGKSLAEHLEATNHVEALAYTKTLVGKKREDIDENIIREINRIILSKIEEYNGGIYRTQTARIKGSTSILPNPAKVPALMKEFVDWLKAPNSDHVVKIAADAHYKLVSIHPFSDGNGRTSRLLMNLILMQSGFVPAIIRKEDRIKYIDSLEKAQTTNDMEDYYNVIYEAVERSLDIYLEAIEPERRSLPQLSPEQRFYTTDEVASLLKVDPESVRRYVRSGKLRAVKLSGKFIRIDKADLDNFIESLKN